MPSKLRQNCTPPEVCSPKTTERQREVLSDGREAWSLLLPQLKECIFVWHEFTQRGMVSPFLFLSHLWWLDPHFMDEFGFVSEISHYYKLVVCSLLNENLHLQYRELLKKALLFLQE